MVLVLSGTLGKVHIFSLEFLLLHLYQATILDIRRCFSSSIFLDVHPATVVVLFLVLLQAPLLYIPTRCSHLALRVQCVFCGRVSSLPPLKFSQPCWIRPRTSNNNWSRSIQCWISCVVTGDARSVSMKRTTFTGSWDSKG